MEVIKYFGDIASQLTQPLVLTGFVFLLLYGTHKALIKSGIFPKVKPTTGGVIVQKILRYGFWLAFLVIVLSFGLKAYDIHQKTRSSGLPGSSLKNGIFVMKNQIHHDHEDVQTAHGIWADKPPVLDYRFEKESNGFTVHNVSTYGVTTDKDQVGNGKRGSGTSIVAGKRGKSLQFDSSKNAFVAVPIYPNPLKEIDTNFSIEATVLFDTDASLQNGPIVCDRNIYNDFGGVLLRSWQKRISFSFVSPTKPKETVSVKSPSLLRINTWYHIVATFDNGTGKVYINGVLENTKNATFNSTAFQTYEPLYLGASKINPTNLQGRLDDVRVFNRTLSSREVKDLYHWMFR